MSVHSVNKFQRPREKLERKRERERREDREREEDRGRVGVCLPTKTKRSIGTDYIESLFLVEIFFKVSTVTS